MEEGEGVKRVARGANDVSVIEVAEDINGREGCLHFMQDWMEGHGEEPRAEGVALPAALVRSDEVG